MCGPCFISAYPSGRRRGVGRGCSVFRPVPETPAYRGNPRTFAVTTACMDVNGLDEQAREDLDEEGRRHREALAGLTIRETSAVVQETARHLDHVEEIMRRLMLRSDTW